MSIQNFGGLVDFQAIYVDTPDKATVMEPVLDISQPLMTLLVWTVLFGLSFPANMYDWYTTKQATLMCQSQYGPQWEALSEYAVTGRGNPTLAWREDRTCYNPMQCGMIELNNPHFYDPTNTIQWYMAYKYKEGPVKVNKKDPTKIPALAMYAIPIDGALWFNDTTNLTQITSTYLMRDGWSVKNIAWATMDGKSMRTYIAMMWDVDGTLCKGYYNCPDLTKCSEYTLPSNYNCNETGTCLIPQNTFRTVPFDSNWPRPYPEMTTYNYSCWWNENWINREKIYTFTYGYVRFTDNTQQYIRNLPDINFQIQFMMKSPTSSEGLFSMVRSNYYNDRHIWLQYGYLYAYIRTGYSWRMYYWRHIYDNKWHTIKYWVKYRSWYRDYTYGQYMYVDGSYVGWNYYYYSSEYYANYLYMGYSRLFSSYRFNGQMKNLWVKRI